MASQTWFARVRAIDVRILAAVAAALMLIVGVMWVVPTTPDSKSFVFDTARRGISNARAIESGKPVQGNIVDGSDEDFYRIDPLKDASRLDVHMVNGSDKMIPGLRVFDAAKTLLQDKTTEYARSPGASVDVSLLAQSNTTYYVQVFSQRNTTGSYTLTVTARQP